MTVDEKLEALESEVKKQRKIIQALLRVQWHNRGEMKGQVGKIEKELEGYFQEWLDESKVKVPLSQK